MTRWYYAETGKGDRGREMARALFNVASRYTRAKLELAPEQPRRSMITEAIEYTARAYGPVRLPGQTREVEEDVESKVGFTEPWFAALAEISSKDARGPRGLTRALVENEKAIEAAWRLGGKEALYVFLGQ